MSRNYTRSSVQETLGDGGIQFLPSRSFQTGSGEKGIKDVENDLERCKGFDEETERGRLGMVSWGRHSGAGP